MMCVAKSALPETYYVFRVCLVMFTSSKQLPINDASSLFMDPAREILIACFKEPRWRQSVKLILHVLKSLAGFNQLS